MAGINCTYFFFSSFLLNITSYWLWQIVLTVFKACYINSNSTIISVVKRIIFFYSTSFSSLYLPITMKFSWILVTLVKQRIIYWHLQKHLIAFFSLQCESPGFLGYFEVNLIMYLLCDFSVSLEYLHSCLVRSQSIVIL